MKTYRVKTLSVSGRNNKIHRLNDVVTDKHFVEGRAAELVKGGYIELVSDDGEKLPDLPAAEVEVTQELPEEETPAVETPAVEGEEEVEGEDLDSTTRDEIKQKLTEMGVSFSKNASKKALYELYEANKG